MLQSCELMLLNFMSDPVTKQGYMRYVSLCIIFISSAFPQVCDCQSQFARWEDGQQRALPCFTGCHEPEFTRSLLEIETHFHHGLQKLGSVGKCILDVNNVAWHSDFNKYDYSSLTNDTNVIW